MYGVARSTRSTTFEHYRTTDPPPLPNVPTTGVAVTMARHLLPRVAAVVALTLLVAVSVSAQPAIETDGDTITVQLPSRDADLVVAFPNGDPISIKGLPRLSVLVCVGACVRI